MVADPVHVLMHIEQEPREPIVARSPRWGRRDVSGSQRRTPMMNDNRKSDSCVVPKKPANKPAPEAGAESVEGRRLVKGNELENDKSRTPRRKQGLPVFERIRLALVNRRHLRQEPDAVTPQVRICGGGAQ